MMVRFEKLLSLSLSHEYHGGELADVELVLPEESTRLLRGRRHLAKVRGGELEVLYEANGEGVRRASLADGVLRIGLRQRTAAFSNYTALPCDPRRGIAYYTNPEGARSLAPPEARRLVGSSLSLPLDGAGRPVRVTLQAPGGHDVKTLSATEDNGVTAASFDLAGAPVGPYSVVASYAGGATRVSPYFVHPELVREGVFAVVDLLVAEEFYEPNRMPAFRIDFSAREETLHYYVVARAYTDEELSKLDVVDRGHAEEGRAEVRFEKILDAAFSGAEVPSALLARAGERVVLFRSLSPVARRRRAMRKIELVKNGDVLIEHLPQPSPDKPNANLIVHISK